MPRSGRGRERGGGRGARSTSPSRRLYWDKYRGVRRGPPPVRILRQNSVQSVLTVAVEKITQADCLSAQADFHLPRQIFIKIQKIPAQAEFHLPGQVFNR